LITTVGRHVTTVVLDCRAERNLLTIAIDEFLAFRRWSSDLSLEVAEIGLEEKNSMWSE